MKATLHLSNGKTIECECTFSQIEPISPNEFDGCEIVWAMKDARIEFRNEPLIGSKWVENDPRSAFQVLTVTKIGDGTKAGKVQFNNSDRKWAKFSRLNGKRGGYSILKPCPDCRGISEKETEVMSCATCGDRKFIKS